MTEIDERLDYIRKRVDVHAFHNAHADIPYLLDLVTGLRAHDANVTDARQEWERIAEVYSERIEVLRQQLTAAEQALDMTHQIIGCAKSTLDTFGDNFEWVQLVHSVLNDALHATRIHNRHDGENEEDANG